MCLFHPGVSCAPAHPVLAQELQAPHRLFLPIWTGPLARGHPKELVAPGAVAVSHSQCQGSSPQSFPWQGEQPSEWVWCIYFCLFILQDSCFCADS